MSKRFTEGICGDGAAILDNGKMLTVTEVLKNLNKLDKLEKQLAIQRVVGQSEQLVCEHEYINNGVWDKTEMCHKCYKIRDRKQTN